MTFEKYLKLKASALFAAIAVMCGLGACQAADIQVQCPADSVQLYCPQTISTSTPSPLVWGSTQTETAPFTLLGGDDLTQPALKAPTLNGIAAGTQNGVNLLDPNGDLYLYSDGGEPIIRADSYFGPGGGGPGLGPVVVLTVAEGSKAVPAATIAGDDGAVMFKGYNGSTFPGSKARIQLGADENWNATSNGTHIKWSTTANGTTSILERMRLNNAGQLLINKTVPSGSDLLEVNGSIRADTQLISNGAGTNELDGILQVRGKSSFLSSTNHTPSVYLEASGGGSVGAQSNMNLYVAGRGTSPGDSGSIGFGVAGTGVTNANAVIAYVFTSVSGAVGAGDIVFYNKSATTDSAPSEMMRLKSDGTLSLNSGTQVVVRCLTAGALPAGTLTADGTQCGSSTDTKLRVP